MSILKELKQTTWPSLRSLALLVVYTILSCGIISVLILGIDIFLIRLRDIILK